MLCLRLTGRPQKHSAVADRLRMEMRVMARSRANSQTHCSLLMQHNCMFHSLRWLKKAEGCFIPRSIGSTVLQKLRKTSGDMPQCLSVIPSCAGMTKIAALIEFGKLFRPRFVARVYNNFLALARTPEVVLAAFRSQGECCKSWPKYVYTGSVGSE
jgi:hypothetical protein